MARDGEGEEEELDLRGRPLARRKAELFSGDRARAGVEPARALRRIGPPGDRDDPSASEPESQPQPQPQPVDAEGIHMVDVAAKPVVARSATAEGFLRLKPETVGAIREGRVKKGDPFPVAQTAGIMGAKATPQVLPLCHPIPLTGVDVHLTLTPEGVRCEATVRADYKTGVEMEALTSVTLALLTVWDMTKYLEKDANGQYPATRIEGVRVLDKRKGAGGP